MARIARVVAPGIPHHIIQRGNRNQTVFFKEDDKMLYLRLLKRQSNIYKLRFWAYCLMDNHVHLVAVPENVKSFRAIAETHKRYTQKINERKEWKGYLWQGRFLSYPMDARYLYAAVRYAERNPVRAGMVERAWEYPWSSAQFHVHGTEDFLVEPCFLQEGIDNWKAYLTDEDEDKKLLCKHFKTGRPLGEKSFVEDLEKQLGRKLAMRKPGRKPKINE